MYVFSFLGFVLVSIWRWKDDNDGIMMADG
jgi:hypothetical protein